MTKRYRLKIKRLDFISAVDAGAQGDISNVALIKRAGDVTDVSATFTVAKTSPELGLVFGWCMASSLDGGATDHVDLQDDHIESSDELIKACSDFMLGGGAADVMHDGEQDGRVVFMMPLLAEVKQALGVTSDVEGVACAIKFSPATFKRYQSGELRAFSIGGEAERSPLEKSAPAKMTPAEYDARIAELEQKIRDAQVANAKAAVKRAETESLAWINSVAKAEGMAAARVVAGYNVAKAGAEPTWADRWLAQHPAPVEVAKAAANETEAQVFKRRTSAVETTLAKYNAAKDAIAKGTQTSSGYVPTAAGLESLYAEFDRAQRELTDGVPSEVETRLTAEIDTLTKELAAMEDAAGLAWNMEPLAVRARLPKVSREYDAKFKRMYAASTERSNAIAARRVEATRVYRSGTELLDEQRAAEAEAARRSTMMPAEKRLAEHVESIQKAKGLTRAAAMTHALDTDPKAQALYAVMSAEQAAGRALPEMLAKALSTR